MNADERRQYEMLLRLRDFSNTHRDLFATSPVAQEAFASVDAAIKELTETDLVKMSSSPAARAGRKEKARKLLTEVLVRASQLARVLRARGKTLPVFALPASRTDQGLLSTARQFARDAEMFEAEFTGHGVGAKAIGNVAAAFEMALRDRGMKRADFTAARARIRELIATALLDVRRLDLIVDNELAGNTAVKAVWKQARRVLKARGVRPSDVAAAPSPSPAPPPAAPAAEVPVEEPSASARPDDAGETATQVDAPTPATVIEMPSRQVA